MRTQNARWPGMGVAICAFALWGFAAGCGKGNSAGDADSAVDDGGVYDAAPADADAALPDASIPPDGTVYGYCSDPFFKLHIGGEDEGVRGLSIWGSRLAYARGPQNSLVYDVYSLNLETCTEHKFTSNSRAAEVSIHEDTVFWTDNRESSPAPDFHCFDLYEYNLDNWVGSQLTDHPYCEWSPVSNGRYVAYSRSTAEDGGSPREYLLWDRTENILTQFAKPGSQAGYFTIDNGWLAWSGYPEAGGSLGKDVYFKNLATGEDTQLPNSANYYCYEVALWEDHLAYVCSDLWEVPPYHLFLHHMPTGVEEHLDGNDGIANLYIGPVALNSGIVAWNTSKHSLNTGPYVTDSDVELYDIETGLFRRLTTAESMLRVVGIYPPWIVFVFFGESDVSTYYVGHLGRLGVIDADGRLLSGDAVLDPPL